MTQKEIPAARSAALSRDAARRTDQDGLQPVGDADDGDQGERRYERQCARRMVREDVGDGSPAEPDDEADGGKSSAIVRPAPTNQSLACRIGHWDRRHSYAHTGRRLQSERQHEHEGIHVDGVLVGGERVVTEPAGVHRGGGEGIARSNDRSPHPAAACDVRSAMSEHIADRSHASLPQGQPVGQSSVGRDRRREFALFPMWGSRFVVIGQCLDT